MSFENNKMQVDIENLFKQNVNDLSAIKELYRKLKEVEEKITHIKYIDSTLANKLKKEYEKLKRIILDENIQTDLSNAIDEINFQMLDKVNFNDMDNKVWSMDNMGQDVKEAMTGGSVAVVGTNAVGTINLQNNSVTNSKIINVGLEKIINTLVSENDIERKWNDNICPLEYSINSNTIHITKENEGNSGLLFKTIDMSLCKDSFTMKITHKNNVIVSIWITDNEAKIIKQIAVLPIAPNYKTSTFRFDKSYFEVNSFKLLIAMSEPNCDVYLKDFTFKDNSIKFTERTLGEILNSIYGVTNTGLIYDNIKKNYKYWGTPKNIERWGTYIFNEDNNIITLTHPADTGNSGIITPTFTSESNFVTVKGNITDMTKNTSNARVQIIVFGYNTTDESEMYITIKQILEVGEFREIIDLNNLVVYNSLDLNKPIQIILGTIGNVSITVKDYAVYEDNMDGAELVGDNLKDTCITFNNQINSVKNKLTEIEGSLSTSNNILVSPNGTKYLTQVTNEGNLISIPVIPNKTLFIGNSLLLGHDTFGMCATNSKEDYYYHVTQYIKSIKPSATFQKVLGAPFEMSESQEKVDEWINFNIKSKDKDFDLVIIQLGDNVNNTARNELFKTSCEYLIKEIRKQMPKTRICWVGEWYYTQQKQEIIAKACINTGSTFIDISSLRQFKEYEGNIGDIITRDNGTKFEVTSTGVASHPGNLGMKAISDMIIEKLF